MAFKKKDEDELKAAQEAPEASAPGYVGGGEANPKEDKKSRITQPGDTGAPSQDEDLSDINRVPGSSPA